MCNFLSIMCKNQLMAIYCLSSDNNYPSSLLLQSIFANEEIKEFFHKGF